MEVPNNKIGQSGSIFLKEYKQFCKNRNIETEYYTTRMRIENGVVERSIQTIKSLIVANPKDGQNLTESVNRAVRVMGFTIHTGLKITMFE